MEMLLLAELISYPYHLGRINLNPFTSLIVSPHARKVLGVLVEMRKNNEDVNLVNVSYRLSSVNYSHNLLFGAGLRLGR